MFVLQILNLYFCHNLNIAPRLSVILQGTPQKTRSNNNMKISKEAKVGILAITCFVILYYGFNYLKGMNFLSPTNQYVIVYDKLDGLTLSNPVQISGLRVGQVSKIALLPNKQYKLAVTISVNDDIQLTNATTAYLGSTGVLGTKCIVLDIKKGTKEIAAGDTLVAGTLQDMMSILSSKAEPMLNSIDSITSNLNALLAEYQGMSGEVRKIMTNVQNMTANFNGIAADNRQNIKQITDNAAIISKDLVASQKKLEPILVKMNTFADSLNAIKMAGTVNKANVLLGELNKTMTAINQQKGSAGKLVYNDSLYNNLNKTLEDLDKLFIDLKEQPKKYVHFSIFGKKEKVVEKK